MLQRKIEQQFHAWKEKKNHKPLVVFGARQVGKTFSIRQFARKNYKHVIELNFDLFPEYSNIFSGNLDVDQLLSRISLTLRDVTFEPGETLFFFDEIQSCPNARTSLKAFAEDGRYDVIASGSLLGVMYKDVRSYPVGYEEYLEMFSLDFEEFLWARGYDTSAINSLYSFFKNVEKVPVSIHKNMMDLFREFLVVGGMPEAVSTFLETSNFQEVLKVQRAITKGYDLDITKYAVGAEKTQARECFLSIPKQLGRDYKKFKYADVERGGNARKFAGSLEWLRDAMIVNFCYNLEQVELPLEGNANPREFKVYMNDTGLLVSMLEEGSQKQIIDNELGIYKGAVYENCIAEMFTKKQKPLYYYAKNGRMEFDFVTRLDNEAVIIEAKAGRNRRSASLSWALQKGIVKKAIKLSPGNLGEHDGLLSIPLYMGMFL